MMRVVCVAIVMASLLGGCVASRQRSDARSESVSAMSVSGVSVSADVSEAMLEGVEITMADTTVSIGRVTLTRRQSMMADVVADSLTVERSASSAESESEPAARPASLLPWFLLLLILMVRFTGK